MNRFWDLFVTVYIYSAGYAEEGFLTVQRAIDSAIIETLNSSAASAILDDVSVRMVRFPYPAAEHDMFTHLLHLVLPLIILLCYGIAAPNLIRDIVLEKEKMIKVSNFRDRSMAW